MPHGGSYFLTPPPFCPGKKALHSFENFLFLVDKTLFAFTLLINYLYTLLINYLYTYMI